MAAVETLGSFFFFFLAEPCGCRVAFSEEVSGGAVGKWHFFGKFLSHTASNVRGEAIKTNLRITSGSF